MKEVFLMKKFILSMLAAFVLIGANAYASGDGDYIYFSIEAVTETEDGYDHTMISTPMKVYENGFYDYTGKFTEFDGTAQTAADAIDGVLSAYMSSGIPLLDGSEYVLEDYDNGDGSYFSSFQISGTDVDTPSSIYAREMSDGLGVYDISEYSGGVFRLAFASDFSVFWNGDPIEKILPASDELIAAMGDYCEALAKGKASEAAAAYSAAVEGFFGAEEQEELAAELSKALNKPESSPGGGGGTISITPELSTNGSALSGKIKATLDIGAYNSARVIAAMYDKKGLIWTDSVQKTLGEGATPAEFENISAEYTGEVIVKVFVWDSFGGFKPLAVGEEKKLNQGGETE